MPFDAAKLAKLQAQAAQTRIGAYGGFTIILDDTDAITYYLLYHLSFIILNCMLTCPPFSSHLWRLRRRFRYRQLNLLSMDLPNNALLDILMLNVFARRARLSIVTVYAPPSGPCRPGGKGTVRRKVVKTTKASGGQDDRKLQAALKKLNMQPISNVEELNMFREDGSVLHFSAPKGMCYCPCSMLRTESMSQGGRFDSGAVVEVLY